MKAFEMALFLKKSEHELICELSETINKKLKYIRDETGLTLGGITISVIDCGTMAGEHKFIVSDLVIDACLS